MLDAVYWRMWRSDCDLVQRDKTSRNPSSMSFMVPADKLPEQSARKYLSIVTTCDTLATLSLGSPVIFFESITLPGESANRKLVLSVTAIIVLIRLLLKSFDWMMTRGLLWPGPEPAGS